MAQLSLEVFDKHINSLRAQLQFLNEALATTDHHAPDWLATDLISLRNKSGRLQDDMKRFRNQLDSVDLADKKIKTSNKRLSIEKSRPAIPTPRSHTPTPPKQAASPPIVQPPTLSARPAQVGVKYVVQHVDITEEVSRRLRESRLRRLMETPSTAHKRKHNLYDEPEYEDTAGAEDQEQSKRAYNESEWERTPTKRLKSSGMFEQLGKRKDNDQAGAEANEDPRVRADFKRRKY